MTTLFRRIAALLLLVVSGGLVGCASKQLPGEVVGRSGDEIVVAGTLIHTGTPVVLWTDPGGYDGYRVERRFAKFEESDWRSIEGAIDTPNRYGVRAPNADPDRLERVRGGGWSLDELRSVVDQIVIHYDVCGTSRECFRILHDVRGLSVHFMIDLDGTIYQTLDVKERAWHATIANDRSIGIEIANIGAVPVANSARLDEWYTTDERGTRITLPKRLGDGGLRTPAFIARPARPDPVAGEINGQPLVMYDLTNEQYDALVRLVATLTHALPRIAPVMPADERGTVLTRTLTNAEFEAFRGVLGHFHVQSNKTDPGPAFDWKRLEEGLRRFGPTGK